MPLPENIYHSTCDIERIPRHKYSENLDRLKATPFPISELSETTATARWHRKQVLVMDTMVK
jgi:hypothetical protein